MPNNLPSSGATSRPRRSSLTDRNIDIMREHCDKVISTPINQEEAVEGAEPVRTNRQHWEEHVSDEIEERLRAYIRTRWKSNPTRQANLTEVVPLQEGSEDILLEDLPAEQEIELRTASAFALSRSLTSVQQNGTVKVSEGGPRQVQEAVAGSVPLLR
ncbi:unnamed protein product [Peniophora sp. CBMAI 1063]|nr:unnamed protein product [Peniophora sp. CBMAI 1063]